jgi:hypothetical protein
MPMAKEIGLNLRISLSSVQERPERLGLILERMMLASIWELI